MSKKRGPRCAHTAHMIVDQVSKDASREPAALGADGAHAPRTHPALEPEAPSPDSALLSLRLGRGGAQFALSPTAISTPPSTSPGTEGRRRRHHRVQLRFGRHLIRAQQVGACLRRVHAPLRGPDHARAASARVARLARAFPSQHGSWRTSLGGGGALLKDWYPPSPSSWR